MKKFRNSMIAAAAGVALVAGGAIVAPAQANANGKELAWIAGGLVAGVLISQAARAHQAPVYGTPYYGAPVYRAPVQYAPVYRAPVQYAPQPTCWWKKQKFYDPYYGWTRQKVKICR